MLKKLALHAFASLLFATGAHAADATASGNLTDNTDVVEIDFTLASAGAVTLWTDSWRAGLNFDPSLSLFDAGFALLATGDDTPDPAALLPGQGGYDSQIRFASLAAGLYHLTLTASGNDLLGSTLGSGFSLMGTTPIPIGQWNQPSYDINANDQKGPFWQVHLDGIGAVSPVPEPSELALMLAGLGAIGGLARRRALRRRMTFALSSLAISASALAADQTMPGAGNGAAEQIVARTPRVREAHAYLVERALRIKDGKLRAATLDLLRNRDFCVSSRAGVDAATQASMIATLLGAGLLNPADEATFPGGLKAGVFPPVLDAASRCPHLPIAFSAAPGSAFTSHHGYPGGLPIHEANNLRAALGLVAGYRESYGDGEGRGEGHGGHDDEDRAWLPSLAFIDQDVMIAAPIWHDWAKTIVFQWTAEGQEFVELNIGGTPANGSATGGHHILSIAESMKRGLSPVFVIAQASAHSAPTLGNEFKVVAWLRAAGILARVDPVAAGYLMQDAAGYHLPALRKLGDGLDLLAANQTHVLAEYTLHNLSDGDFTFSIPAAAEAALLIAKLAPLYGFDSANAAVYNRSFRNPVFANTSQERLLILYANGGLAAVQAELDTLHARRVF